LIGKNGHISNNEQGSSLVETLVALAILMAVLIPLMGLVGIWSASPHAKEKVKAAGFAQALIEQSIYLEQYNDSAFVPEPGWQVIRTIEKDDAMVKIRVDVYRSNKTTPVFGVSTIRIKYETSD